ncbi:MAG TPA: hypothetical protein PLK35_00590 [Candidatus Moranbacteria bacterium]|nr:hypothetical protein [Candidatus Moranbacteria bacterium]
MKKHKASILVVSLIILGAILVIALSISLVSIKERKASIGGGRTNLAYQAAETGVETVLNYLTSNSYELVNKLPNCDTETGKIFDPSTDKRYEVVLKNDDGDIVPCNSDDTVKVGDITSIKSTGLVDPNNRRAIEAAVAAGSLKCRRITKESESSGGLVASAVCDTGEFVLTGGGRCETGTNFCGRSGSGVVGSMNYSRPYNNYHEWRVDCNAQDDTGEACAEAFAVCCQSNPLAISFE